MFNNIKLEYEEALKSGHTLQLMYSPPNQKQNKARQKPHRKIIQFNSPFNLDVLANVAKTLPPLKQIRQNL